MLHDTTRTGLAIVAFAADRILDPASEPSLS
jgi:hypothetical protein